MPPSVQIVSILVLVSITHTSAEAPPGYVKPPETADKDPPKYEYGYNIEDAKGTGQGKAEARDGIYALGRYYVQGTESSQNVQYYADDWGYHPFVEYSNVGPHSRTRTQLLLGVEAVKALASNKFTQNNVPPKQEVEASIQKINQNRPAPQLQHPPAATQPQPLPQPQVQLQPQLQIQPQPQVIATPQPQVLFTQQPQPQPHIEIQHPQTQQYVQVQQVQPQHNIQIVHTQPQQSTQIEHKVQPQYQPDTQPQQILQQQLPPPDNIVYFRQEPQPQAQPLVFIQQLPSQQNALFQHIQETNSIQDDAVAEQEKNTKHLETAALYEANSRQVANQQTFINTQDFDEAALASLGGYGSKIGAVSKNSLPVYYLRQEVQPTRLIETTRNLVSGEDVLNINGAFNEDVTRIESSTEKAIVTQHTESSSTGLFNDVQVNTKGVTGVTSTTIAPPVFATEASLIKEPIVVADISEEEKLVSSTEAAKTEAREEIFSTTGNTIETVSSVSSATYGITEPSTVLVTPRPVSTNFLAPITAGIQLQSVEHSETAENVANRQNYFVEIQKSLPYYLGKFEYVQGQGFVTGEAKQEIVESVQSKAEENIQLGKTLISFPEAQDISEQNKVLVQQLPEKVVKESFAEADQQEAQHQVVQQVTAVVEKKVPYPVVQTQIVEKPVEVTRLVSTPYPVEVPVGVPYAVEKPVAVPYAVDRPVAIPYPVEKPVPVPVHIEKIVEKPVHYTQVVEKHIPKPYPVTVDRIVEKPVHYPVEVTRYVDRPYPVAQPYPVDRIVEKIVKQPYPVEVAVPQPVPYPVDRIIEKIVKHPYPVEVRIPVEVKVPVPHYIEKQVPVEKIVEKPVPHYIDRPYPVEVKVPVPVNQQYVLPVDVGKPFPITYTNVPQQYTLQLPLAQKFTLIGKHVSHKQVAQQQNQQLVQEQKLAYFYTNPYAYAPTHSNKYLPPKANLNNGYLPPANDCQDQQKVPSSKNFYYTIKPDDYIGLLPPRQAEMSHRTAPRKFRNARSNFNSNLRLEYGFMPPLIPSQEIDEHGNPIEKSDH